MYIRSLPSTTVRLSTELRPVAHSLETDSTFLIGKPIAAIQGSEVPLPHQEECLKTNFWLSLCVHVNEMMLFFIFFSSANNALVVKTDAASSTSTSLSAICVLCLFSATEVFFAAGPSRGWKGGKVFPGPATFGGGRRRSKLPKMVFQMASF